MPDSEKRRREIHSVEKASLKGWGLSKSFPRGPRGLGWPRAVGKGRGGQEPRVHWEAKQGR